MIRFLRKFRKDASAASAVEMAVLAPALIAMMFGTLQIGLYFQAQNALRGLVGDIGRKIAVEYQKDNHISTDQMETLAIAQAITAPYMLSATDLDIDVGIDDTQDLARVKKIDINVVYDVPNIMGFSGIDVLTLDIDKTVFIPAS